MTKRRILFATGIGAIACAVLIATLLWVAIGTGWFGHLVCHRIVSGLENATGGRVSVHSCRFDWHDLTAELDGLSIRRADQTAPFLRVQRMRLQFGVVSVLRREVDLASLVLDRPNFDSALAPHAVSNTALHLRVHRFQIVQGVFQADLKKFNITARGEDLNASIVLASAHPRYDIAVSAQRLRVGAVEGSGSMRAYLENGRLTIEHLSLSTDEAALQAQGVVHSLAHPVADFTVTAHANFVGRALSPAFPGVTSGRLALSAKVHCAAPDSWSVTGNLSGKQIAGRYRGLPLKNVTFDSDFTWAPSEARLSHLKVSALGGDLSGTAIVRNGRNLDFNGAVAGARIRDVALLLAGKPLDWDGAATGRIQITDEFQNPERPRGAFKISAAVRISPLPGKTPVGGNLQFSYRSRGDVLVFGESELHLPHTQLAFSGTPRGILQVTLETKDMDDLTPLLSFAPALKAAMPEWLETAGLRFSGQISGATADPQLQGDISLRQVSWAGQAWGPLRGHLVLSRSAAELSNLTAGAGPFHASGTARIGLEDWAIRPESALEVNARFAGLDLAKALAGAPLKVHISAGTASGSIDLSGSLAHPSGAVQIGARKMMVDGERLDAATIAARLDRNQLQIEHARFTAGKASATVSGVYHRVASAWNSGSVHLRIDSSGFPVEKLLPIQRGRFGVTADLQVHGAAAARIVKGSIEPTNADGVLTFRNIELNGVPVGSAKVVASTSGSSVQAKLSGEIRRTPVSGTLRLDVAPGTPAKGELRLDRISLAEIGALVRPPSAAPLPVSGWMEGGVEFDGPLEHPAHLHALAHIDRLQILAKLPAADSGTKANDLAIRNVGALVFEIENGVAQVRSFHLGGEDTGIAVLGSVPCSAGKPMNITVGGSVGMRIFELFDPNVRASGQSLVSASIRGTFSDPLVDGTLEIQNGSFFLNNVPNGLTAVNGTVSFDRSRATIDNLTAQSGGGKLNLGGFVSFGGGPLVYNVEASAQNVRIRPAASVSVTADGSLRLSGTSDNSILGGTVSVSHIVLSTNSDWGALLASASAPVPSPGNAKNFISGLQFDVHVVSALNLQLSSSLGRDLTMQMDLQLRGTPNQPVLLGSVSANQGELKIFGANYTINHADVRFTNPVEIEPAVDFDLQTQAHGITVNITVTGSLNKLNINYRSDPPLQPRDIIALLAVGETPGTAANVVNAPTAAETAALESSANTVLGQAITPESGRLSKLFGITNIKIDPLAQGSTVTPESRLTIQQQISRNITVTYVTNLAQTSEQIFRLEWALSNQYSVVAERDDNGEFGIDIQYKKHF